MSEIERLQKEAQELEERLAVARLRASNDAKRAELGSLKKPAVVWSTGKPLLEELDDFAFGWLKK